MLYLFSYGTLQDGDIQKELFHRQLMGSPDLLLGFELSQNKVYGKYPVISKAPGITSGISGMAYEISPRELVQVDAYEGEEYSRITVKLQTDKKAWVYIAK